MCQVDKGSGIMVGLNVSLQLELEGDLEMMPFLPRRGKNVECSVSLCLFRS